MASFRSPGRRLLLRQQGGIEAGRGSGRSSCLSLWLSTLKPRSQPQPQALNS